jgi:MbtH protein
MFDNENIEFLVVINDEEQYSIWPAHRDLPNGWYAVGEARPREDCLSYIEEVWTDMRPKSVRELAYRQAPGGPAPVDLSSK